MYVSICYNDWIMTPNQDKKAKKLSPMMQTVIFIAFVLVVIFLLSSISGERSARIPDNPVHVNLTDIEYCLTCHGPGGEYMRSENHPPKDNCIICHKIKRQGRKYK